MVGCWRSCLKWSRNAERRNRNAAADLDAMTTLMLPQVPPDEAAPFYTEFLRGFSDGCVGIHLETRRSSSRRSARTSRNLTHCFDTPKESGRSSWRRSDCLP